MSNFEKDLGSLINSYSLENGSNTPDFILAEFMVKCFAAFEQASNARVKWYQNDDKALTIRKLQTENRMLKRQRNEEAFSYFNEFNDDEIAKKLSDGHIAEHDAEIQQEVGKIV